MRLKDYDEREREENGPPYPQARRAYRVLGLMHAPLFGGILAKEPFKAGNYTLAVVAFAVGAVITLAMFWWLANEHYRAMSQENPD